MRPANFAGRRHCFFTHRPHGVRFRLQKIEIKMDFVRDARSQMYVYEVRPRKDKRGVDLISDVLPFGRLWYGEPNAVANAIGYGMHSSRSHDAVIRVYDAAGNVIETHKHKGEGVVRVYRVKHKGAFR